MATGPSAQRPGELKQELLQKLRSLKSKAASVGGLSCVSRDVAYWRHLADIPPIITEVARSGAVS